MPRAALANPPHNHSPVPVWLVVVLLAMAFVKLGLQLWGSNKGFDVWDEGLYILMLNYFEQYPAEPHNYYSYVITTLLPFKEYSLWPLRLLSIATETLGVLLFAFGFHRFINQRIGCPFAFPFGSLLLALLVFVGAAFLSVYARTFSYNHFSYFTTLVVSGALFLFYADRPSGAKNAKWLGVMLLFILGLLLGAQLVTKFSTALLLLGWAILFVALFARHTWLHKATLVMALLGGFVVSVLGILGGWLGFTLWFSRLQQGVEMLTHLSYDPYSILVKGYIGVDLIENGVYFIAPLVAAIVAHKIWGNRLLAYCVGLIVWLPVSILIVNGFLGEFHYRFIALHIYTLLYWGIPFCVALVKSKQWPWLVLIGMVAALPVMALLGSSNTMTQTLTPYLASWFALIVLFVGHHYARKQMAMLVTFGIIMAYSIVNYLVVQVYNPYGLNAPLTEQTEKVNGLRYLDGVRFDPPTARFFEALTEIVPQTGYRQGGPILAIGDLCGVATAMGGYIPETFWYFSDENAISAEHSRQYNCMHLRNLHIREHPALPLVMINSDTHETVIDCLRASEVPFTTAYYHVSTVYNPYIQDSLGIWAPYNWAIPQ